MAKAESQCAFGESTWQLKEAMESNESGRAWYQQEHISLQNPQRLKGLTAFEREMILFTLSPEIGQEEGDLQGFSDADGYITYFIPNVGNRLFAIIASYPGDNEYGYIVEIQQGRNTAPKFLGPVAVITDGDFEDCKVQKSDLH